MTVDLDHLTVNGQLYRVSTVHLGVSLNTYRYETLVFPGDGTRQSDWLDLDGERYETVEEARKGHARFVAKVRRGEVSV
jgi:hypothetical protein